MPSCFAIDTHIHRLATETLIHIFLFHADPFAYRSIFRARYFRNELENLANLRLLTLSKVCSRWRTVSLETPTLWTKIDLDSVLWRTPARTSESPFLGRTVGLLASVLRRSRELPLIIRITSGTTVPLHPRVFHLLASHSYRWASLTIFCDIHGICFSGLEGRLPMLENLQLEPTRVSPPNPFNYLKVAPALRRLNVTLPLLDGISKSAIQNLVEWGCEVTCLSDIARAISTLSQLPTTTSAFGLALTLFHNKASTDPSQTIDLHITPQTSTISSFSFELVNGHPQHSLEILAQILASLTLPALREIQCSCTQYPRGILEWPHAQFIALSERSGFSHTLKILNVAHVRMGESALLEVLSVLASLEELHIADRRKVDSEGANVVLITDALLRAITCAASGPDDTTSLIPQLRVLHCASRLQFTHKLLLEFVSSRLELAPNLSPFLLQVRPLTQADGRLDAKVQERLEAMWSRRRRFEYCFRSAEYPALLGL
ncbi:hypothetical protein GGX14DRAFT_699356 [Mycena pura]|uniref:F-box domain-containing protein n=1 Tax=Mycena pura TaxID=153505 RepID=A0AAD6YC15_9AGAR|nr:hypothetical protein GGX14DRAFT_699356 [Mycena pura]